MFEKKEEPDAFIFQMWCEGCWENVEDVHITEDWICCDRCNTGLIHFIGKRPTTEEIARQDLNNRVYEAKKLRKAFYGSEL